MESIYQKRVQVERREGIKLRKCEIAKAIWTLDIGRNLRQKETEADMIVGQDINGLSVSDA